jgi:hypothetical protein
MTAMAEQLPTDTSGHAWLAFGLTVYCEPAEQLSWSLGHLRRAYPAADVFVISDGSDCEGYRAACAGHAARYLPGERLKTLENGARWWERFFTVASGYKSEYVFKMDPDTQLHRPFRDFPRWDVFGSYDGGGRIQGGIQGFSRAAVETVLRSGICLDPAYADASTWATEEGVRGYVRSLGQISTDFVLAHIVQRLGLTYGDWPEVNSLWRNDRPFRQGVAATHPHKMTC